MQKGDRHRDAVLLNGIVKPDMSSSLLTVRTVASLTVSSQTDRLTPEQCSGAKYALTTTPCTEELSTATGGPNAIYAALGFPWCKLKIDTNQNYAEATLGFDHSESTLSSPYPLSPSF